MAELDFMIALGTLLEAAAESMRDVVNDEVFARSQELVPRDTGALAASGMVSDPVIEIGLATVTIAYGTDPDTAEYAVPTHEMLGKVHPVGQAKWLEQATTEAAPTFAAHIAAKMRGR